MREQTMFIKSVPFVEELITLQENVSKEFDRKREKLVRLVLRKIDEHNGHLEKKCGSKDHIIAKFPKPPKDNEKQ